MEEQCVVNTDHEPWVEFWTRGLIDVGWRIDTRTSALDLDSLSNSKRGRLAGERAHQLGSSCTWRSHSFVTTKFFPPDQLYESDRG